VSVTDSWLATVSLPSDQTILIRSQLDAPRHLVYRAWTMPHLVERWWTAGRARSMSVEIDLRVGGSWRYALVDNEGNHAAFRGEFREIVPDQRLIYTEIDESAPARIAIKTLTLSDANPGNVSQTQLELLVEHRTRQDRDAYLETMGDGLDDALALLARTAREPADGE
jgi:uncharacterized protein YndB with AHSA1/START domain